MASAASFTPFRYPGVQIDILDAEPIVSVCFIPDEVQSGLESKDVLILKDRCKFVNSRMDTLTCQGDVVLEGCTVQKVTAQGHVYLRDCLSVQEVITEGDILIEGTMPIKIKAKTVFTTASSISNICAQQLYLYHGNQPLSNFIVKDCLLRNIRIPPTSSPTLTLDHSTGTEVVFGVGTSAQHPSSPMASRKVFLAGGSSVEKVVGCKTIITHADAAK